MKFDLMSDLHLEFDSSDPESFKETLETLFKVEGERSDTLIVAGDITPLKESSGGERLSPSAKAKLFFDMAKSLYKDVVYVLGNHDYWTGVLETEWMDWEKAVGIRPLVNDCVEIEGVTIFGSTMWTKIPDSKCAMVEWSMNDYRFGRTVAPVPKALATSRGERLTDLLNGGIFTGGIRKLTPYDTNQENAYAVRKLKECAKKYPRVLVVTHHAPLKECADRDSPLNVAYCNNLKRYLTSTPSIIGWCHGHLHGSKAFDMDCGTHIFANPRGYIGCEPQADSWTIKQFEV